MQNVQCKMQNAEVPIDRSIEFSVEARFAKPFDLCERFLDFADRVCSVVEALPDTRVGRRIADQLLLAERRRWEIMRKRAPLKAGEISFIKCEFA